ncbi:MAG: VWA domain-containing protein [Pyrinomonadaceae bacterium]
MRFRILFLLPILAAGFCAGVFGQIGEPPKIEIPPKIETDEVVKIETRLVEVPIVVTDKSGKPLLNLKKNDFVVYENGQKQEITEFSTTAEPFEVALLLDTSGSTRNDLRLIRRAALNFIRSLRTGDRVSIIAFNAKKMDGQTVAVSEIITPLTEDRAKLEAALEAVSVSNGTPYYDGMLEVLDEVFREKPTENFRGRRAVVALTDGVDSSSLAEFDEVRKALGRTGAAAYFVKVNTREFFEELLLGDCMISVRFSAAQMRRYYRQFDRKSRIEQVFDFCKLGDFERLAISKRLYELADSEMNDLAKLSGGKVFPAASLSDTRMAFDEVAAELGTRYSLGYYSTNQNHDGTYRKIKVELKSGPKNAEIRAREGYTAPNN